jgi:hypothetical protein
MPTNVTSANLIFQSVRRQHANLSLMAQCEKAARCSGLAVALLGALALADSWRHMAILKSLLPGNVTMTSNTALGFVLARFSVLSAGERASSERTRQVRIVLAGLLIGLGLLTLGQYLLAMDWGIDRLLLTAARADDAARARMAMASAVAFLFTGLALFLLDRRVCSIGVQWAAMIGILVGLLTLLGHAYGANPFYALFADSSVALPTAIAFVTINIGILLARPEIGLVGVFTNDTTGGIMARRVLPIALIAPFIRFAQYPVLIPCWPLTGNTGACEPDRPRLPPSVAPMLLAKPDLLMANFTGVRLKALGLDDDPCSPDNDTDSIAVGSALPARLPEPRVAANSCCKQLLQ